MAKTFDVVLQAELPRSPAFFSEADSELRPRRARKRRDRPDIDFCACYDGSRVRAEAPEDCFMKLLTALIALFV